MPNSKRIVGILKEGISNNSLPAKATREELRQQLRQAQKDAVVSKKQPRQAQKDAVVSKNYKKATTENAKNKKPANKGKLQRSIHLPIKKKWLWRKGVPGTNEKKRRAGFLCLQMLLALRCDCNCCTRYP